MSRKISDFVRMLNRVADHTVSEAIKLAVAEQGLREIQRGFASETDPYGQLWLDVEYHKGHKSILRDSGALKDSFHAQLLQNGVKFYSDVAYAAKQNQRRKMLPTTSKGLGTYWTAMVNRVFSQAIVKAFHE